MNVFKKKYLVGNIEIECQKKVEKFVYSREPRNLKEEEANVGVTNLQIPINPQLRLMPVVMEVLIF